MSRLLVSWTWTAGGTTIAKTSGYTDAEGRARSTLPITADTTRGTITVTARTSAASINAVGERHAQARGLSRRDR